MVTIFRGIKAAYESGLPSGTVDQSVEVFVEPHSIRVRRERGFDLLPLIEVAAVRVQPANEAEWVVEIDSQHGGRRSALRLRTESQKDAVALEQAIRQARLGNRSLAAQRIATTAPHPGAPRPEGDAAGGIPQAPSRARALMEAIVEGLIELLAVVVLFISQQNMTRSDLAASGGFWLLFAVVSWAVWTRPLGRLSAARAFRASGLVVVLGPISLVWWLGAWLMRRDPLPVHAGQEMRSSIAPQLFGGFVGLLIVLLATGFRW